MSTPSEDEGSKPFSFTDRRRIDPQTGTRRDAGAAASSSPYADFPGDPAAAQQPLSVDTSGPELEAARQEAAERTADLQRVTAEYANYRKRVDRDREQVLVGAKAAVLTELLVVLDDIDRANSHGDLTGAFKAVADKLTGILTRLGLHQVGAVGDAFDPAQHEAVQFATSPEVTEQVIAEVLRHGYSVGERLVRPAVVVVNGPESDGGTGHDSGSEPAAAQGVSAAGSDAARSDTAESDTAESDTAESDTAESDGADSDGTESAESDATHQHSAE